MLFEINWLVRRDKRLDFWFKKVGWRSLRLLKIDKIVSVAVMNDKRIKMLNKKYRKKNAITDVLSFGSWEDKNFLGEIVISLPQIKRQAEIYQTSLEKEAARLLIHGILHLAGFDHEKSKKEEKRMLQKQEKMLNEIMEI